MKSGDLSEKSNTANQAIIHYNCILCNNHENEVNSMKSELQGASLVTSPERQAAPLHNPTEGGVSSSRG
jgi:hypothetical protein